MKYLKVVSFLFVVVALSTAFAKEGVKEKLTKKAEKSREVASKTKEKVCHAVNGKEECSNEQIKDKAQELKTEVFDKIGNIKNKGH